MKRSVYRITNLDNQKSYIGLTERAVKWRIKEHFDLLRRGKHKNKDFQQDYNKNENGFFVEILQSDIEEHAHLIEKQWMITFKTNDPEFGYNSNDIYWGRQRYKQDLIKKGE